MDSTTADLPRTTLYLVRHGETDYNRKRIMQGGGIDSRLNQTGREQAEILADRLADIPFDVIYSSPMHRARETAKILARRHHNLPRKELDDLREMAWGVFEGEPPSEERDAALQEIKASWRQGNFDRRIEGGESVLDVQKRATRAAEHLVTEEAGSTALVVTHGRYLRVLLATVLDDAGLEQMHSFGHDNTCVNRLVHEDGRYVPELLNCTAHLEAVEG
jgi:probable phosphoglycerate mutase